jgi:hypothetical protein
VKAAPTGAPDDVDTDLAGSPRGERSEQLRDSRWHAGPHQHVVDAGQHRSVDGGRGGELDLLQVVDADPPVMAAFGQEDLGEVRGDQEFVAGPVGA